MTAYLTGVAGAFLTTLFFVFVIAAVGYLVGGIEIKGISLGTAGVLLMALVFGVIANYVPSFQLGEKTVVLFDASVKPLYSLISSLGTSMFVTAVGLIAGPKFFRGMNKASLAYVFMGVAIIGVGVLTAWLVIKVGGVPATITAGLLTGGLTTTPGLSAAKEAAGAISEAAAAEVTAGYGIAYIFGVLGVVFFVQLVPKFLKVNMEEERKSFTAADTVKVKVVDKVLKKVDDLDFFPFLLTAVLGMILGAIKIPGINFSLGSSGGALIMGLIVGHFGHIGKIDLSVSKNTLNFFRELGLMLFLVGAGVPGGVNFMTYVKLSYFIYGAILTTVPMIVGYILGKYVFKLSVFNNLGSITGGMTSTPALGTLIHTAGTDAVTAAYAATYPMAMVLVVLAAKFIVMFF